MSKAFRGSFVILAIASLLFGCSESDDPMSRGQAAVRVELTDAPSDYIRSAEVVISSVLLVPASEAETDGTFLELLDPASSPMTFDLLELRDGVTAFLADKPVPEDTYGQLRMIVGDATVTLVDGYTFDDGTSQRTLKVPSGPQTGIKVHLDESIVADDGTTTVVVVDFDVDDSFVIQGNPDDPAGIRGMLFTPVLREKSRFVES